MMYKLKAFLLVLILLISNLTLLAQNKLDNLGLISELVYQKSSAENIAIRILNDSIVNDDKKKEFLTLYSNYKTSSDQFILQMISTIQSKNSIKLFKKIDNALFQKNVNNLSLNDFKNHKVKAFIKGIKKLNSIHNLLINYKFAKNGTADVNILGLKGFFPSTASLEEVTGVLSFVSSTIKDIREAKRNKVEKISLILDSTRLKPLQELLKPTKETKK